MANSSAFDDLCVIHDFTLEEGSEHGTLKTSTQTNKLLSRLLEKLSTIAPETETKTGNNGNIDLEIDEIKNMYLSFDSATLTSNIVCIDLHEMIECLAHEIKQMIVESEVNSLAKSNADVIKSLLQESFILLNKSDQ